MKSIGTSPMREAQEVGPVEDFEDDGWADGDEVVQVDLLEDLSPEAAEARGDIPDRKTIKPPDEDPDAEA